MEPTLETIPPALAARYLEHCVDNRNLSGGHVDFLARQMKEGKWVFNGDSIRFNGTKLIDGQHRLWAVIQSGVPLETVVIRGLGEDAQGTIDTGRARSASDVLAMRGYKNTHATAGTARLLISYLLGQHQNFRGIKVSNDEVVHVLQQHPDVVTSVHYVCSHLEKGHGSRVIGAFIHYVSGQIDIDARDSFFGRVCQGLHIKETKDPAYQLRTKLARHAEHEVKITLKEQLAYWIMAWNHSVADAKVSKLRYSLKNPLPDFKPMPIMRGMVGKKK